MVRSSDKIYRVGYDIIARVLIVCSLFDINLYIPNIERKIFDIFSSYFINIKFKKSLSLSCWSLRFFPRSLNLKKWLCSIFYSHSQLLLIDALPHYITKQLDDGPKKEAAIKKTMIKCSYLSKPYKTQLECPHKWETKRFVLPQDLVLRIVAKGTRGIRWWPPLAHRDRRLPLSPTLACQIFVLGRLQWWGTSCCSCGGSTVTSVKCLQGPRSFPSMHQELATLVARPLATSEKFLKLLKLIAYLFKKGIGCILQCQ